MGHIIPAGDGLHQPTNAADTSLYMQRLFIGADSAAGKAQSERARKEKQPAGKLQTPGCLPLCAFVNYFMFSSTTKCSVYVPGDDRASTWRHSNCSARMRRLPTPPLHCGAKLEEHHCIRVKVDLSS